MKILSLRNLKTPTITKLFKPGLCRVFFCLNRTGGEDQA